MCEFLFLQLKVELMVYVVVEECFFYVYFLMEDGGFDVLCYVFYEYYQVDELFEELLVYDKYQLGWIVMVKQFSFKVCYYFKEEELKFFQVVGCLLLDVKKDQLGCRYLKEIVWMCKYFVVKL